MTFKDKTRLTKSESDKLKAISSWLNDLEFSGHISDFDADNIINAQECIDGIVENDANN